MDEIKMDSIDQAQQQEIEKLKRKDVSHDTYFSLVKWGGLIVVMGAIAMFAFVMETLSKTGPYNCPHTDCVHHKSTK